MPRPTVNSNAFNAVIVPEMRTMADVNGTGKKIDPAKMIHDIAISEISPNPRQPRTKFNQDEIDALAKSMAEREAQQVGSGVIDPVLLAKNPSGGYWCLDGWRRRLAAEQAGLSSIPARIREDVSDDEMLLIAMITFDQKVDLSPIERAKAYQQMEKAGLTRKQIAEKVGRKYDFVLKTLWVLDFPPYIADALNEGKITYLQMVALHTLIDDKKKLEQAFRVACTGVDQNELRELSRAKNPELQKERDEIKAFRSWARACKKSDYVGLVSDRCGEDLAQELESVLCKIEQRLASK